MMLSPCVATGNINFIRIYRQFYTFYLVYRPCRDPVQIFVVQILIEILINLFGFRL
jgi:hypothetical protein